MSIYVRINDSGQYTKLLVKDLGIATQTARRVRGAGEHSRKAAAVDSQNIHDGRICVEYRLTLTTARCAMPQILPMSVGAL